MVWSEPVSLEENLFGQLFRDWTFQGYYVTRDSTRSRTETLVAHPVQLRVSMVWATAHTLPAQLEQLYAQCWTAYINIHCCPPADLYLGQSRYQCNKSQGQPLNLSNSVVWLHPPIYLMISWNTLQGVSLKIMIFFWNKIMKNNEYENDWKIMKINENNANLLKK